MRCIVVPVKFDGGLSMSSGSVNATRSLQKKRLIGVVPKLAIHAMVKQGFLSDCKFFLFANSVYLLAEESRLLVGSEINKFTAILEGGVLGAVKLSGVEIIEGPLYCGGVFDSYLTALTASKK
ncbi:hypothetical protein [Absidia glauca]|uniref:Uncharacterized protein n=1 Tax=Absidia glauca TaxID=4829 RepID=A0A168R1X5_ABSGL|nr:hypothetical protein [Absidia glauca]